MDRISSQVRILVWRVVSIGYYGRQGATYAIILFAPPLRWHTMDRVLHHRFFVVIEGWFWRAVVGGIVDFENGKGVHGNAVRLATGCDTSLQQPRILGVDIWSRAFVVRVRNVDSTNLDTFSPLDVDTTGGVPVSFGHGEGARERERDVDRTQDTPSTRGKRAVIRQIVYYFYNIEVLSAAYCKLVCVDEQPTYLCRGNENIWCSLTPDLDE